MYNNISATSIGSDVEKIGSMNFASTSVTFSNPIPNEKTAITFVLTPTFVVKKHESFIFKIPGMGGQSVSKADFLLSGASAASFDAEWDDANDILSFTAKAETVADTTYTLVVDVGNRLRIPVKGFVNGMFSETTFKCDCVNGNIYETPVQEFFDYGWPLVYSAYTSKMIADATKITDFSELYFEFEANDGLQLNDQIDFQLPGVTCPAVNKSLTVIHGKYKNRFNATWLHPNSVMVLKLGPLTATDGLQSDTDNKWSVTVGRENGCKLPATGFHMNTDVFKYRIHPGPSHVGPWTSFTSTSGIGFLTSQLSFSNPVADGSTFVELNLKYSLSQKLYPEEGITFYLPGFASTQSTITLSGADASHYTAAWFSTTNKLIITPTQVVVPVVQYLTIPASNKFLLPTAGIVENDQSFTMSLEQSASETAEMGKITGHPIRLTQPVGAFSVSQIRFSNPVAGAISGVEIKFSLSGAIAVGESVIVKIGRVTNTEDLTEPLNIYDFDTSAASTVWNGVYNALSNTITLECLSAVNANTVVNVKVMNSDKLVVPVNGTVVNDPNMVISTNAAAAPVLVPVAVKDSQVIGALVDSNLYFYTATAGGNFMGHLEFTFNKVLDVGDSIKVHLPNFVDFNNVFDGT